MLRVSTVSCLPQASGKIVGNENTGSIHKIVKGKWISPYNLSRRHGGEQRHSCTLSLTSALDGGGYLKHALFDYSLSEVLKFRTIKFL